MPISPPDDPDEKPLDPEAERVRRRLVRFMVINLGLLFAAVIAVLIAVVYKAGSLGEETDAAVAGVPAVPSGEVLSGDIPLPRGASVVSQGLSGQNILLRVELAGGEEALILYDMGQARVTGRFALVPEGE